MRVERVAHWADVLGNFGVIVTLVLLIIQVQDNTQALRGQAIVERSAAFTDPFMADSDVPAVLAKIKAVDGPEPVVRAYMDEYNLTYEEGAIWLRHMLSLWTSLEAEYAVLGESEELTSRIEIMLPFRDVELWFDNGGHLWLSTPQFREYIERVRAGIG